MNQGMEALFSKSFLVPPYLCFGIFSCLRLTLKPCLLTALSNFEGWEQNPVANALFYKSTQVEFQLPCFLCLKAFFFNFFHPSTILKMVENAFYALVSRW